jgi:hypothetical protein
MHQGAPVTLAKLRWLLGKATSALGAVRLADLSAKDIYAWRQTVPDGHRFDATQALRQVLRRAVEWDWLSDSPAKRVPNPPRRSKEKRPFESWEEIEAVAAQLRPVYGPMVVFAAATGLRPSELFGLEWRDVDHEAGVVYAREYRCLPSPVHGSSLAIIDYHYSHLAHDSREHAVSPLDALAIERAVDAGWTPRAKAGNRGCCNAFPPSFDASAARRGRSVDVATPTRRLGGKRKELISRGLEKPSGGLESPTPLLTIKGGTRAHARSFASMFVLQIAPPECVARARA